MKKFVINKCMKLIKNNNNYSEEKLAEIRYGIESIYLTYTKIIIILVLAYFLGIIKDVLLLLITYNLIRSYSFGLHATKSIYCLITSLCLFIGGVFIAKYVYFPLYIKVILSFLCLICLYKYAPADTHKRPLINVKKRKKYKIISVVLGIIYSTLIIYFNSYNVSNYLLIGMIESVLMIHPLVYKLFNLPFNNYKKYNANVV